MSNLTDDQVKHVAKLAKLTLTDPELKKFQKQLSAILSHVEELSKVETSEIEPTSQTTGLTNVLRMDAIDTTNILSENQVFLNTDKVHNKYFVVDAVIDKDI